MSAREPRKRLAVEPPTALLRQEPAAAPDAKRPPAIAGGAALVLLRSVGGIVWLFGLLRSWPEVRTELDLDASQSAVLLGVIIGFEVLWLAVLAAFAWLIWRGSGVARMLAMFWSTVSITASAVTYFTSGQDITIRTTLLTLALDILLLLALSSREARRWTRGRLDVRAASALRRRLARHRDRG
ncbi:hypothetical protein [Leucobacter sp. USHLN153]|uniref:hypothetical protein n=1 Tax=Leucobacter sp. USHLN153 TaxID=3081268 RepID=UPI003015B8BD